MFLFFAIKEGHVGGLCGYINTYTLRSLSLLARWINGWLWTEIEIFDQPKERFMESLSIT